MTARIGVVTFPGTLDDRDTQRAVRVAGAEAVPLWHRDKDVRQVDAVVLPGGFSYGDYLRAGAISRFSPVMETIIDQAKAGMPVLGICNGFQVLTEAHLLPGAMLRNNDLHFVCRDQKLRVETGRTAWTADFAPGQEISIPLKNIDGRYTADERTLDELEAEGRVVFRYAVRGTATEGARGAAGTGGTDAAVRTSGSGRTDAAGGYGNPNGSLRDIAGISNAAGNVVGLMPHPEHAVESLTGTGGTDGLGFFTSVLKRLVNA